jgi:hypothetical protein
LLFFLQIHYKSTYTINHKVSHEGWSENPPDFYSGDCGAQPDAAAIVVLAVAKKSNEISKEIRVLFVFEN